MAHMFWTLGRHGRCRRTRITGHAVSYWLEQVRRRGGLDPAPGRAIFGRTAQAQGAGRRSGPGALTLTLDALGSIRRLISKANALTRQRLSRTLGLFELGFQGRAFQISVRKPTLEHVA